MGGDVSQFGLRKPETDLVPDVYRAQRLMALFQGTPLASLLGMSQTPNVVGPQNPTMDAVLALLRSLVSPGMVSTPPMSPAVPTPRAERDLGPAQPAAPELSPPSAPDATGDSEAKSPFGGLPV